MSFSPDFKNWNFKKKPVSGSWFTLLMWMLFSPSLKIVKHHSYNWLQTLTFIYVNVKVIVEKKSHILSQLSSSGLWHKRLLVSLIYRYKIYLKKKQSATIYLFIFQQKLQSLLVSQKSSISLQSEVGGKFWQNVKTRSAIDSFIFLGSSCQRFYFGCKSLGLLHNKGKNCARFR